ncbi:MAG: hypothetical protein KF878_36200 [Planctomycetes bacterium]|nr:hypothetical protein [Planctomycetota bacterium]
MIPPDDALRAMADDPTTLAERFAGSPAPEDVVLALHDLLIARPELVAALRARAAGHQREVLERWLRRTLLAPVADLTGFLRLATEQARARWPGFPALRAEDLRVVHESWRAQVSRADVRSAGTGWTAEIQDAFVGPGDCIRERTWRATALHPDGTLTVGRDAQDGFMDRVWAEWAPSA